MIVRQREGLAEHVREMNRRGIPVNFEWMYWQIRKLGGEVEYENTQSMIAWLGVFGGEDF